LAVVALNVPLPVLDGATEKRKAWFAFLVDTAMTVAVRGMAVPAVGDWFVVLVVTVEPVTWIGIVPVAVVPDTDAVIDAVRFVGSKVPDENVAVTLPLLSVVELEAMINPVDDLNCTVSPGIATLLAFNTVAVTVTDVESSLFTLVAVVASAMFVAAEVVGVVPVAAPPTPPPPHPLTKATAHKASIALIGNKFMEISLGKIKR
jgi:hypothetical protein